MFEHLKSAYTVDLETLKEIAGFRTLQQVRKALSNLESEGYIESEIHIKVVGDIK